jgi:hypothetical protein
MERVLQNNLKPATHFIEVYKHKTLGYDYTGTYDIRLLHVALKDSVINNHKTIAIFKIRAK